MKLEIIKQQKNPFLEREELTLKIENNVTPNFNEVKEELGKDMNLTVIKKINTNFGKQTFTVEAVVYDSNEAKKKIETIPQKIRKKMAAEEKATKEAEKKAEAEAKAKAEEPAPETPVETPAEEPKVETPAEEPKPEEPKPEEPTSNNEQPASDSLESTSETKEEPKK